MPLPDRGGRVFIVGTRQRFEHECRVRGLDLERARHVKSEQDVMGYVLAPEDEVFYADGDPALIDALEARRVRS